MKFARKRLLNRFAAVATFALTVCLIGARPFTPGLTYKVRMVMTMPQMPGMAAGDMIIVGHGVSANGQSRLDIDSGGGGPMAPFGPGDYLLTLDSGRVLLVSPATKTYVDGFTMGGGMPAEVMAQATVSGISVNLEKLGAGESIEGRATQKYRLTSQYTINIMGQSVSIGSEGEMLTAEFPIKLTTSFGGGLPKAMASGPFSELYNKMVEVQKQITGSVVKSNTVMSINGPMSMNMTQNLQLVDIKNGDVDEKQFAIPTGFTARPPGT